jgi:glycosyltransferase involved in cell wall biosynthesis
MIIGIDANEANLTSNRVGVNQYAFALLHALYKLKTDHKFIIYLKTPPLDDLPKEKPGFTYRVIPFPKLWTQTRLPWDLYTHSPRPDVFFSMTHYAPRFSPIPTVVAIMDLGFLSTPEQFTAKDYNQLKSWTGYSIRNANRVIAISEFTKSEINRIYNKPLNHITVTPLAYDKNVFKPTHDKQVLKKYDIEENYLLFLGNLKPSKNVERLIKAFAKLSLKDLPVRTQLVIAGKKGWLYEGIYKLVQELKLESRVVFTGFVEDADVPILMTQAKVFVMPSLYEGFGIPVLEAMACGTPVVASSVTSLPEVAGDAGIYVNPAEIGSIMDGIREALGPEGSRKAKLGLARVKLFNWDKTALHTIKCLETATAVN